MTKLDELFQRYSYRLNTTSSSNDLSELVINIILANDTRNEIISFLEQVDDPEYMNSKLNELRDIEYHLSDTTVPKFDDELENVQAVFDEYEPYFLRFNCQFVEHIVSWDRTNILIMDSDQETYSVVQRPDLLTKMS